MVTLSYSIRLYCIIIHGKKKHNDFCARVISQNQPYPRQCEESFALTALYRIVVHGKRDVMNRCSAVGNETDQIVG